MVFPLLVVLCIKAVAAQIGPITGPGSFEPNSTGAGILTPGQTVNLTVNETAPLSQFAVGFGSGSAFSAAATVFPGPNISSTSFDLIIPSLSATTAEVFISFFGSTTLSAIATVTLAPETSSSGNSEIATTSTDINTTPTSTLQASNSSSETSTNSTDISSTSAILITGAGSQTSNADTPTPTDTVTTNPSLSSTSLSASVTAFISNSPSSLSRTKNIRAIIGGTIGAVLLVLLTLIALFLWIKRRHKPEPMTFRGDIMVRASHNGSTTSSPYETMPVLGAYKPPASFVSSQEEDAESAGANSMDSRIEGSSGIRSNRQSQPTTNRQSELEEKIYHLNTLLMSLEDGSSSSDRSYQIKQVEARIEYLERLKPVSGAGAQ